MRIKLILLSAMLTSCSGASAPLFTPYKMDIRQGNYVMPEARDKLKIGMNRAQVRYVLGSPTINDAFHSNRWDYVYRLERDGKLIESQNMALYFDGDNLVRIEDGIQAVENMPAKTD